MVRQGPKNRLQMLFHPRMIACAPGGLLKHIAMEASAGPTHLEWWSSSLLRQSLGPQAFVCNGVSVRLAIFEHGGSHACVHARSRVCVDA